MCILFVYTLLKVVSYYDLSCLSMLVAVLLRFRVVFHILLGSL